MNLTGGEVKILTIEKVLPFFIEFPKDKFCSIFDGLIYCYCFPSKNIIGDIDINQFKQIIQVVLKSPVDLLEFKIVNLKLDSLKQIYIGSHKDCEIQLNHPTISERHAMINIVSSSEIWLTDLKSRYGTLLNERNIFPDIETPVKMNDSITFGLVRSYLKSSNWLYSSLATRFARQLQQKFERIVIRYFSGEIIKKIITDIEIHIDRITIRNALTGQLEHYKTDDLKAVFWVKNLIGDPSRVDRQGFVNEADPSNIFIEFKDGECQWGNHSGYSNKAYGFYFYPHDPDSNNAKCYIPRDAINYVLL